MNYNAHFIYTVQKLMNSPFHTYEGDVRPTYENGEPAHSRFLTNHTETWNVADGVPMTSLRPIPWKSAIKEYLWIFQKQTSELKVLKEEFDIHWWDSWEVEKSGTIGQRYGATISKYDQVNRVIKTLKEEPYTRRHVLDMYQFADFDDTDGLHPCLFCHIFNVRGEYLDLMSIQRSSDYLVAGDINKVQSVALLMMFAKTVGLKPGNFTWGVGNLHIYNNQYNQAKELKKRFMNTEMTSAPVLKMDTEETDFFKFTVDDFIVENYEPIKPQLKFRLAI